MNDMDSEGSRRSDSSRWSRWFDGIFSRHSSTGVLFLVTLIFACHLVIAIAVIPPWQGPDEPQHFAFVRVLTLGPSADLDRRQSTAVEGEVVQSMARHGWWRHYGTPQPDPLPTDFSPLSNQIWRVESAPSVYYTLAAVYSRMFDVTDLLDQYYRLRWASAFLAILTLWCAWAGSDLLFGRYVATGSAALLALNPQIAWMSTNVNPAVLVNLFGAIIWWQSARLVTGNATLIPTVVIVSIAGLGVFTKRVAASFVGMAGLASLYAFKKSGLISRQHLPRLLGVIGAVVLVVAGLARLIPEELIRLREHWSYILRFSVSDQARSLEFFTHFTTTLFDSAWLWVGWLSYPAPLFWLLTLRVLTLAAIVGLVVLVFKNRFWRRAIAIAGSLVSVQIIAIYGGIFLNGYGPQGHYLFPVMAPWMTMLWIGLHGWWPHNLWPVVGTVILATLSILDIVAWSVVIVPAYLS